MDRNDAPLTYKLYRDRPVFPLIHGGAADALEEGATPSNPDCDRIGHFLWYVFGLTQVSQTLGFFLVQIRRDLMQSFRRFAPSGGALYPNELYVYLKMEEVACRWMYHYDVAHHRLVLLREGNFDEYLEQKLLGIGVTSHPVLALFLCRPCFGKISINTIIFHTVCKDWMLEC